MLLKRSLMLLTTILCVVACSSAKFNGSSDVKTKKPEAINGEAQKNSPLDISNTIQEDDRYGQMVNSKKTTPKPGGTTAIKGTENDPGKLNVDFFEEEVVFKLGCDEQNKIENFSRPANTRVIAVVEGKICPVSTTKSSSSSMNVVFVVDYSASMGPHTDTDGSTNPGHDPMISNSCGRLQGAQSVINQLMSKYSSEQVYVSFIGFAETVEAYRQPQRIDTFKSNSLNAELFCRYVPQSSWTGSNDPGFINTKYSGDRSLASGTNYITALNQARALLQGNQKPINEVYFITDGEQSPSHANSDALKAADNLRTSVTSATINAIYLNSNLTKSRSTEAISVLTEITRSSDRVRSVSSASELANSLASFKETQVQIETARYPEYATLTVSGYSTANIGIQSVKNPTDNEPAYVYRTQPFYLVATDSGTTKNTVDIKLQSVDGTSINNRITINYTKTK